MHTFMDAKLMAKLLRQALAERNVEVSHSDTLEMVARQFGFANWNILSAKIESAGTATDTIPEGWSKSGNKPKAYTISIDPRLGVAAIESKPGTDADLSDADFCTLLQAVDAAGYRGKRLRLQCELKAVNVSGGVTPWFRIDGPLGSLRFENLERYQANGPIAQDTDWTMRSITLDVPQEATTLNFGFYLKGSGRGLVRAFKLEEVDGSTALNTPDTGTLSKPTNLGFQDNN